MTVEMRIRVTESGFGIDCDFNEVGVLDKFELLHSVAAALEVDKVDMILFCQLERMGVFTDAQTVTKCETAEQLDRMLHGEGPGAQAKSASEQDMMFQFLQKMSGDLSVLLNKMEGQK